MECIIFSIIALYYILLHFIAKALICSVGSTSCLALCGRLAPKHRDKSLICGKPTWQ